MSIKSKPRGRGQGPLSGDKPFNRQTFDVVVDVPDTEGLDRFCQDLDDLVLTCFIDHEDVFSLSYAEREKKMRVSLMPQDRGMGFRFVNEASGEMCGQVTIPVALFRHTARVESLHWMNLRQNDRYEFGGQLGMDDEQEGYPRMLLNYAILPEEDDPPTESEPEPIDESPREFK